MSVRHTLLGLLARQPQYGYELRAAFTALAGGRENWDVTPAQVYTTLNRMLESDLVSATDAPPTAAEKRVFSITSAGRDELERWLRADIRPAHQQDTFYLKLMLSRDLDFVDTGELIRIQRAGLYRDLHRATTRRSKLDPRSDLARIFLLDKAIMHLEADLRWLDMIEARLEEVYRQPAPEPDLRPRGRPQRQVSAETQA